MVNSLLQLRLASLLRGQTREPVFRSAGTGLSEAPSGPETQRREVRRKVDGYSRCCLMRRRRGQRQKAALWWPKTQMNLRTSISFSFFWWHHLFHYPSHKTQLSRHKMKMKQSFFFSNNVPELNSKSWKHLQIQALGWCLPKVETERLNCSFLIHFWILADQNVSQNQKEKWAAGLLGPVWLELDMVLKCQWRAVFADGDGSPLCCGVFMFRNLPETSEWSTEDFQITLGH